MKKHNNDNLLHLKRKYGEILTYDVYINKINSINILSNKGKTTFNLEEHNEIIYTFPSYLRKKIRNIYKTVSVDKKIIQFYYLSNKKEKNIIYKKDNNFIKKENNQSILKPNDKNKEEYIENNKINKTSQNNNKTGLIKDININLKEKVENLTPIDKDDLQLVKIIGDGNCLYRCISFFLLGNEEFYNDIKNYIIRWIDNNREKFEDFFGDTDISTKIEQANEEYNYIKQKNSWGGFHTIEISCLIFNISIAVYTDNGDNKYNRYSYSENLNKNSVLMLLLYHINFHFDLLYDKSVNINKQENILTNYNLITYNNVSLEKIKYQGSIFSYKYVLTNFKGREYLYDEISNYLKSLKKYDKDIKENIIKHPELHINQIISLFKIVYPKRLEAKTEMNRKKNFRKEAKKYKLDENNRLII